MSKKIYRSQNDIVIGGVCGGLGEAFNIDSNLIRIVFILFAIFGAGIVVYLVLWAILPISVAGNADNQQNNENVNTFEKGKDNIFKLERVDNKSLNLLAFTLIFIGILLLLNNLFLFLNIYKLWPLLIILVGFIIIFNNRK